MPIAVVGAVTALLLGASAAFAYFSVTSTSSLPKAMADALNQGSTPVASVSASTVSVAFGKVTTAAGASDSTYSVTRYDAYTATSSGSIAGTCSVTTSVSCSDTPGTGAWYYTDTPTYSTNWTGTESAASNTVYLSSATGLSPTSGAAGTAASITADGFIAQHSLTVSVGGTDATVTSGGTSDANGSSTVNFTIPDVATGSKSVVVSDGTHSATSATDFVVTPGVRLSASSGTVGSSLTLSGTGFPAGTAVTLSWDGAGLPFTATTNSSGDFGPAHFTVPEDVAGSHTVSGAAGSTIASTTFTVIPKITVSVGSGVAGTTATVSGTGFAAGVTPTATFNGTSLTLSGPGNTNTDSFGSFDDATFTIPSLSAGSYSLTVTAGTGHTASTSVTVGSATGYSAATGLTATESTGNSSMSGLINVGGSCTGCSTNETFSVYVDGTAALGTVTTGSSASNPWGGGATTGFGLPAGIVFGSSHVVTIIDTNGKVFANATLSLSQFLTPSPSATASPGSTVSVSGANHTLSGNSINFSEYFDSTSVATGSASTSGAVTSSSTQFSLPASTAWGTHLISLKQTSGADSGYFTPGVDFVVPKPTLTSSGTYQSGQTITIGGTGFKNSSTITATYAGSTVSLTPSTSQVNSTGAFSSVTFKLPTETASTYPLIVTDSAGNFATLVITQTG